jgi:hypothetical protein
MIRDAFSISRSVFLSGPWAALVAALGAGALSLAACGGGGDGDGEAESTSAGPLMETSGGDQGGDDDDPALANLPEEAPEPEPQEPPPPTYGDPVSVAVQLQVGSEEGTGRFTVLDLDGVTVAEGQSGETVTLPTGPYTVEAQVTDEDELIDTPTRRESIEVGEMTPMVVVRFPSSRVRLNIRQNGRAVRRATVTLLPQTGPGGPDPEPIAVIRNPRQTFRVSPGRYDALIRVGNLEVPVQNLVFQGGAEQEVPVNIN